MLTSQPILYWVEKNKKEKKQILISFVMVLKNMDLFTIYKWPIDSAILSVSKPKIFKIQTPVVTGESLVERKKVLPLNFVIKSFTWGCFEQL